jgi:hypothetical protein
LSVISILILANFPSRIVRKYKVALKTPFTECLINQLKKIKITNNNICLIKIIIFKKHGYDGSDM